MQAAKPLPSSFAPPHSPRSATRHEHIVLQVRAYATCIDGLGILYAPGELQKVDLAHAKTRFAYPDFIVRIFQTHAASFLEQAASIVQIQSRHPSTPFVYGLFITDSNHQLVDFCVQTEQSQLRRRVLLPLMQAQCTPQSFERKTHHFH